MSNRNRLGLGWGFGFGLFTIFIFQLSYIEKASQISCSTREINFTIGLMCLKNEWI